MARKVLAGSRRWSFGAVFLLALLGTAPVRAQVPELPAALPVELPTVAPSVPPELEQTQNLVPPEADELIGGGSDTTEPTGGGGTNPTGDGGTITPKLGSTGNGSTNGSRGGSSLVPATGATTARNAIPGAVVQEPLSGVPAATREDYGSAAGQALGSAAGRALRLAAPLAPPLAIAILVLGMIAFASRGSGKLTPPGAVGARRVYRL